MLIRKADKVEEVMKTMGEYGTKELCTYSDIYYVHMLVYGGDIWAGTPPQSLFVYTCTEGRPHGANIPGLHITLSRWNKLKFNAENVTGPWELTSSNLSL
jgi:hypothetical protein